MKIKILLVVVSIVLVSTIFLIIYKPNQKVEPFLLIDKYYGKKNITEIDYQNLRNLIKNKENFAIFVYQPMCITSSDFEEVLNQFLEENPLNIYKIPFSSIKDTDIGEKIKYYPSFIIYKDGKIVDYLEANKDEDVKYYSSKDGFKDWFTRYVRLKDETSNSNTNEEKKNEKQTIPDNISLDYIKKDENKVNIYFFYGDGCPHCSNEFKAFERIKEEYGELYNLYTFETWYNKDNYKLLNVFASAMNDTVKGIPYTIIGGKSFKGFGKSTEEAIIDAIKEEHNKSFDVYFDYLQK